MLTQSALSTVATGTVRTRLSFICPLTETQYSRNGQRTRKKIKGPVLPRRGSNLTASDRNEHRTVAYFAPTRFWDCQLIVLLFILAHAQRQGDSELRF